MSKPMVRATHGGGLKGMAAALHLARVRLAAASRCPVRPAGLRWAPRSVPARAAAFFTTPTTHRDGWSVLYRQVDRHRLLTRCTRLRSRIVERVAELLADEPRRPAWHSLAVTKPVAAAPAGAAEGLAGLVRRGGRAGRPGRPHRGAS
ncbi:hypothetical protein HBB16_04725 [Pseudonocardia sp. MCCB 268]|nr:hypothetical protein [Pseudonocardia cytotoxica]